MIDLKTFSVVATASAALLGFSVGHVSAETAAPWQMAQSNSGGSPTGMGTNRGGEAANPNAKPGGSAPGSSSGATSMGADQCGQISDPRARQDCVQRQNDLRSGSGSSGATGNPMSSAPGTTNRGSGSK